MLLGCDGLFDVFTPEEVVTFVKETMQQHGDAQKCCTVSSKLKIFMANNKINADVFFVQLVKIIVIIFNC